MKYILIATVFIVSSLFANYAYKGGNGGKIDMHGGKKQNLAEGKQEFSKKNFMLETMGLSSGLKDNNTTKKK